MLSLVEQGVVVKRPRSNFRNCRVTQGRASGQKRNSG